MKKNNVLIIAVCVCVVALCAVFALNHSKIANVTDNANETYKGEIKKAKEMPNCVRLSEGKDFAFSDETSSAENEEAFSAFEKQLSDSVFDIVFLKTKALTNGKATEEEIEKTIQNLGFFSSLSEKKKIFLEADISVNIRQIEKAMESGIFSGIALRNTAKAKPKAVNAAVSQLRDTVGDKLNIILELDTDFSEKEMLDLSSSDGICSTFDGTDENALTAFLDTLNKTAEQNSIGFIPFFRVDYCTNGKVPCSYLLDCVTEAQEYNAVTMRGFGSFNDVLTDTDNCFSAVEKYIVEGLDISIAMAKLCIEGYNGETIETNERKASIVITGSDVYPVYFEGEKIYLSSGRTTLDLNLKNGANSFELSQAKTKLTYKINVDFDGEIIRDVEPAEVINVVPGKKFIITVTAAEGAEVAIKFGTARFKAAQTGIAEDGYCEYTAKIKAPKSKMEIDSIGRLGIIASLNGKSFTKDGPSVVCSDETAETTKKEPASEKVTIGNFIESPTSVPTVTQQVIPQDYIPAGQFTGGQMCIVDSCYADTWSPSTSDADYIPYYTTLATGTIDYVVGQCQIYDSEEGETRDFYILASGRKVQTKSVRLIQNQNYGENRIEVISTQSSNGELTVKLKTSWRVPYSFSFAPQNYYSANYKKYNVDSFTADRIQFTFYHTVSASGGIDAGGSDVVSSAAWSIDSVRKTASLVMPLRQIGKYYGYSIRYEADGSILLTVQNRPKSLSGSVIVVDPGHGGKDGGANGLYGAVKESQINFAVSVALKNELEKRGATVYLTRGDDIDVTLEERKSLARQINPDLFISIHGNASVDTSKYGTAVYYFRPMSEPLSRAVYARLYSLFSSAYGSGYSAAVKGSMYHPFSVTRLEECPSILIETGFVTNERECRLLLDAGNRDRIASVIADGITDYFNS